MWRLCFVLLLFSFSLSESPPKGHQPSSSNRKSPWQSAKGRNRNCVSPLLPILQKPDQESPAANSPSSRGSSPSPTLRSNRSNRSRQSSASDPGSPDVLVEELLIEGQEKNGVFDFDLNNVGSNRNIKSFMMEVKRFVSFLSSPSHRS